jgi:hypothetical protein
MLNFEVGGCDRTDRLSCGSADYAELELGTPRGRSLRAFRPMLAFDTDTDLDFDLWSEPLPMQRSGIGRACSVSSIHSPCTRTRPCRSGFALAARGAFHRLGRDIPAASSITEHDSPHPEPRIPPPAVSPCQPYSPFVFFVPFVVSQRMNNPALQHQFHPAHPASRPPIPEGLSPATPGDTRPFGRVNYFLVGGIVFVENADIYASMRRS